MLLIGYRFFNFFYSNPVFSVFPTMTSCSIPKWGRGGGLECRNGVCVLTQVISRVYVEDQKFLFE